MIDCADHNHRIILARRRSGGCRILYIIIKRLVKKESGSSICGFASDGTMIIKELKKFYNKMVMSQCYR